ncbi:ABC transporter ATP-binding protein [Salipaludibacillus sp. LMS25]|uniref:ABC transporter ATP-binding protein n=1 Tax=Salipaludibacillus sp. LMS25 TaxID=2924031 RepID=UPI0020D10055|nr:ABC transporter ATP-binding protein [Salipaludibacillus sp. LMS25]UTR16944.1 ABC transporter ATP-binding protein [Salipaludibacillus sp. LMS25]
MIQLENIQKSYKNNPVLSGFNLNVSEGEMIAIMGRSGVGKSTLLNILAGLEKADKGKYLYKNQSIHKKNINSLATFRRDNIGFILQNYPLIDSKNVFDNIALPLKYSKVPKDIIHHKVTKILIELEIIDCKDKGPTMLSGGQAQRVAIARALIQDPELILADEPTGSLDEESEENVMSLCEDLNNKGKTVIIVTHDREVAEKCRQIYYIKNGECVQV